MSQCVVVGDRRPYLVALVTLDAAEVAKLAADDDAVSDDPASWPANARIRELISEHIDTVNAKFARVEQVKKFEILPADFSQETGELTPTMKVKRAIVADKYEPQIDGLYSG